jgi:branched-chain amino acid transport system permease protein
MRTVAVMLAAVLLLLLPLVGTEYFVNFVLTRTLILGLAASSIIFLSSYVGMVSLAQYLLVGVASFTIGNCVAESGKGLKLGLDPWLAVVLSPSSSPSRSPPSSRSSSAPWPAAPRASTS